MSIELFDLIKYALRITLIVVFVILAIKTRKKNKQEENVSQANSQVKVRSKKPKSLQTKLLKIWIAWLIIVGICSLIFLSNKVFINDIDDLDVEIEKTEGETLFIFLLPLLLAQKAFQLLLMFVVLFYTIAAVISTIYLVISDIVRKKRDAKKSMQQNNKDRYFDKNYKGIYFSNKE